MLGWLTQMYGIDGLGIDISMPIEWGEQLSPGKYCMVNIPDSIEMSRWLPPMYDKGRGFTRAENFNLKSKSAEYADHQSLVPNSTLGTEILYPNGNNDSIPTYFKGFDHIISCNAIHHLEFGDQCRAGAAMFSRLKVGGTMWFGCIIGGESMLHDLTREEMVSALQDTVTELKDTASMAAKWDDNPGASSFDPVAHNWTLSRTAIKRRRVVEEILAKANSEEENTEKSPNPVGPSKAVSWMLPVLGAQSWRHCFEIMGLIDSKSTSISSNSHWRLEVTTVNDEYLFSQDEMFMPDGVVHWHVSSRGVPNLFITKKVTGD